ncbi:copper ion binding protein [Thermosinus carboxydivorans Nor1]|uniref:Copper chaperone CopZ n=1 Tax=Thermosinus carboxydivorans Nor1 TaxID=401526 RepID=A1HSG3_9FIRM|nr:copper ion binding protein [Thermosinus carboxydivorans]EAX47027.1 copper ion binding protein [Thermosinus carboxydivorans Nor1]
MCKHCGCHGGKLEKATLTVEGMSCGHCKATVEKAVRGLPGVMAAEVDLAAKTLKVEFDDEKSSLADIKKAVEDAGYTVK